MDDNQNDISEECRVGLEQSENPVLNTAASLLPEQERVSEPAENLEPSILNELQKVNSSLQELKKSVQEKEKLLQINAEMHEELVQLRNGLVDEIKKPVLMGLIQIYDRLEDLARVNANLPETETTARKIVKTLNDIKLNCLDVLYEFDIEPVTPEIGEVFNPKVHKAIKTIAAEDAAKDKTISSVRQVGFINVSNSRMLRVSSVEVYKKQE